jgi:hypothetical protein
MARVKKTAAIFSVKIVEETSWKIFTGCTQGIVKVPSDPEAGTRRGREVTVGPIVIIIIRY